jgi:hypothetical protein
MMICLGVHKHLVGDGKCKEFMDKIIKRLITKEVDHMDNAKIYVISLTASNMFLVNHLLDVCNNATMEVFNDE